MLTLQTGITGFSGSIPQPQIPYHHFKSACYAAARSCGSHITSFSLAYEGNIRNFHVAEFVLAHGNKLLVLCNAYFPVVTFVKFQSSSFLANLDFVDCADLGGQFVHTHRVLSKIELEANPTDTALALLHESEMSQIKYWRPARVGDIIFNCWD